MGKIEKRFPLFLPLTCLVLTVSGCGSGPSPTATPLPLAPSAPSAGDAESMPVELTSAAFAPGEPFPTRYTCDGDDVSPPLRWSAPPEGTQTLTLIVDDPDAPAGTWVHWVLFNLPAGTRDLPEAIPPDAELAGGARHGNNSWKRLGYGGPCPPGGTHRYFFKLFALDTALNLDAGASKDDLLRAMQGHVLVQTELMGTYTRP
jgi:Raf kinase inhibitor-like YbhB/YbcL family protein